jgi:hypothetical protein
VTRPGTFIENFEAVSSVVYFLKLVVYYESIKRELQIKPIYECRRDGRLQTKRFTLLSYTGLLFIIRVKRELKRVYRNGCRYSERLNTNRRI